MNDDERCPTCDNHLTEEGIEDNWRVYTCDTCGTEVQKPLTSDHGEDVTVEDLQNISEFTGSEQ